MKLERIKNFKLYKLNSTYFDCFSQQLLTLTYFYNQEYWKSFLNQSIVFVNSKKEYLSSYINVNPNLMESMYEYYGIYFEKDNKFNICKLDEVRSLYLVNFSISFYKPCCNIPTHDINDKHSFIVYKKDNKHIYIHDNFYKLNDYRMPIDIFLKGCRDVYKVQMNSSLIRLNARELLEMYIINRTENPTNKIFESLFEILQQNHRIMIDNTFFIQLKEIYSIKYKEYLLIKEYQNIMHDKYIQIIADKIKSSAESWREIWYKLMKSYLRENEINQEVLLNEIKKMIHFSAIENNLFYELLLIKNNADYSMKNLVEKYINDYLKVDNFIDRKVKII